LTGKPHQFFKFLYYKKHYWKMLLIMIVRK